MDYLGRNLKMNKQTADFLETLEGLLTVLEERAKTDA
jgi:hypothetical protein